MSNTELTSQRAMGFTASRIAGADVIDLRFRQFGVIAAPLIDVLRDWFQMSRIDAAGITAQMVELQSLRDLLSRSFGAVPSAVTAARGFSVA